MAMDERIIVEEISVVTREDMVDSKGGGKRKVHTDFFIMVVPSVIFSSLSMYFII